ncbi:thiamine ABC transporter substrate binding subunit [Bosea sp. CS1GBMeth4]|uniref:thiamine ABC transporter substrate binding subunit n=1 Tax=Bosea sp. CS1GBMeth4 TaxID=1892849 RepID=UPI0016493985|nr:thiamine ABC transporter substrate binding subunit [Bosea sp. CS1GBMeth4]
MRLLNRRTGSLVAALTLLLLAAPAAAQDRPVLTVYTYTSLTGKYGPGGKVKDAFEAQCGCSLRWVASDDAGSLLARLKLEGETTMADLVLGLDMNLAAEARATGLFRPHGQDSTALNLPMPWHDDLLLPFDWGHLAFIYDSTRLAVPPQSLKQLVDDPKGPTLVLQDPRTSAPGLGFLLWMRAVYGEHADEAWTKLKPRIVTFTKGWSEAYGLFLKGEAEMVLSYATSPAYHLSVEKKTQYKAAAFAEGHYLHVELAGVVRTTRQPELAQRFLAFMLSDTFQALIPEGNWMMPAKRPAAGLPAAFTEVIRPEKTLLIAPETVRSQRRAFIDAWLAATTR